GVEREQIAEGADTGDAQVRNVRAVQVGDRLVELDVVIVDREVEAVERSRSRRKNEADGRGVTLFGLDVEVAARRTLRDHIVPYGRIGSAEIIDVDHRDVV